MLLVIEIIILFQHTVTLFKNNYQCRDWHSIVKPSSASAILLYYYWYVYLRALYCAIAMYVHVHTSTLTVMVLLQWWYVVGMYVCKHA